MDYQQFKFIKQLVTEGKTLTNIQASALIREAESCRHDCDEIESRMFHMKKDEEDYIADLKYLRELHHSDGVKIDAHRAELAHKDKLIIAMQNVINRHDSYLCVVDRTTATPPKFLRLEAARAELDALKKSEVYP